MVKKSVEDAKELIRFFTDTLIPDLKDTYGDDSGYVEDFWTIAKVLKSLIKGDEAAANNAVADYGGAKAFAKEYLIKTIGADTEESGMEATADDLYESAHVILNLLGVRNKRIRAKGPYRLPYEGDDDLLEPRRNPTEKDDYALRWDDSYILAGEGEDDEQYFPAGTKVVFSGKKNAPGKGLSYAAGEGILAEDARSGGWDVYDLTDGRSIYGFSIEHAAPTVVRPRAERALGPAARPTPKKVMGYAGKRMRKNPKTKSLTEHMVLTKRLPRMVQGYIEAALWSSTDDDGTPLDSNFTEMDLSDEAREAMERDCAEFLEYNHDAVEDFMLVTGRTMPDVGHDLWLTRNRHGTGFWDRGGEGIGEKLTKAAHTLGESVLYVSDDGTVELG